MERQTLTTPDFALYCGCIVFASVFEFVLHLFLHVVFHVFDTCVVLVLHLFSILLCVFLYFCICVHFFACLGMC